jgi:hypothetical protein
MMQCFVVRFEPPETIGAVDEHLGRHAMPARFQGAPPIRRS